jgi:hypothetical protein
VENITGGSGADVFMYMATSDAPVGGAYYDTINDFSQAAGDKIDLHNVYSGLNFIGYTTYTGAGHEVQYKFVGSNTLVRVDINGDSQHEMIIQLTGQISLTAGDFILT